MKNWREIRNCVMLDSLPYHQQLVSLQRFRHQVLLLHFPLLHLRLILKGNVFRMMLKVVHKYVQGIVVVCSTIANVISKPPAKHSNLVAFC